MGYYVWSIYSAFSFDTFLSTLLNLAHTFCCLISVLSFITFLVMESGGAVRQTQRCTGFHSQTADRPHSMNLIGPQIGLFSSPHSTALLHSESCVLRSQTLVSQSISQQVIQPASQPTTNRVGGCTLYVCSNLDSMASMQ